ncbi:related to NOP14 - nuclear and nucleolar protein with possible role in ribosome biogenesis [Cephalotrichum gorgonifer]|uniref:Related to NOP14 - nuclear and nucleolar protein with possible role in ribosome biogenesis n=1 Tax=Cephalotrichum gorgonifer TaxID=2041049 RepID=A0AAE8SQX2_9PEZI|nr:related to NOP14 - nuclear and nucleolar protein with possible role in ribosome biogenesis [Cephalotrichum gorgonifer]
MPPSQLKRLKSSLREQGIIGPQQSKKQKSKLAQDAKARNEKRLRRGEALEGIRDQFNPFQYKHNPRGPKFEVTTNKPNDDKGIRGRPGAAKALSEARRRETLLTEMQRRNRVGGILDRRFGENDPTMAPEDKMLERFAREKQRTHKKGSLFDLEEDEPYMTLTHGGESLVFDGPDAIDDFNEKDLGSDDDSDSSMTDKKRLKRMRLMEELAIDAGIGEEGEGGQPDRKKSRQEIMREVMAKSKMHKLDRQEMREENDELREEVDKELSNIKSLLYQQSRFEDPSAARAGDLGNSFMPGIDKRSMEKAFDLQLKQMATDARAQPTTRTKTEEQLAEERMEKLKELEEKRQRRMRGEDESSESEEESAGEEENPNLVKLSGSRGLAQMIPVEEEEDFGLGKGIKTRLTATELGIDDEDDFFIEDDLVASGSDIDYDEEEESSEGEAEASEDEEEDEFTKGLLTAQENANPEFEDQSAVKLRDQKGGDEDGVPYTFPCPQSLDELLETINPYPLEKLPIIIQRIRALYHPRLDSTNKEKLGAFACSLVDFIATPVDIAVSPFSTLESVIRHLHSLAKTFCAIEIARQFRARIEDMTDLRPTNLHTGDLIILTAVGSIFPTSDHFHQVVTPATLCMTRYLGQKVPRNLADYATGAYLSILTIQHQQLSKRYVPELMNFSLNTLCALVPVGSSAKLGDFPVHTPADRTRITGAGAPVVRKLTFDDCTAADISGKEAESLKVSIVNTVIQVLEAAADTWASKPALYETLEPVSRVLKHLAAKPNRSKLPAALNETVTKAQSKVSRTLKIAELSRRTLTLHHHRPLAVKSHVPKFEERFDPTKHYDPDHERSELAKLKKEHKREKKGAMRELRKDANFMAREKLKIKKAKDEAYENKFRKLVAGIQGEEGMLANEYERERNARKRAKMRR